jgi:hypothetical protein
MVEGESTPDILHVFMRLTCIGSYLAADALFRGCLSSFQSLTIAVIAMRRRSNEAEELQ